MSATYVIDFFEARHRLLTESERIAHERESGRRMEESLSVENVLSACLTLSKKRCMDDLGSSASCSLLFGLRMYISTDIGQFLYVETCDADPALR